MTDTAGRGVDQDTLPGLETRRLEDRLPGGERDERDRRGFDVGNVCGLQRDLIGWRRDVFRLSPGHFRKARHAEHLVAFLEVRGAALDHGAGNIPA